MGRKRWQKCRELGKNREERGGRNVGSWDRRGKKEVAEV